MRTTSTRIGALAALAIAALCAGCLYRMPIQQGNFLDPNQVAQLETGMTRSQVSFLLGTPMVPNGFNNDRWDYYHYLDEGRGTGLTIRQSRRITVWFKNDVVERIESGTIDLVFNTVSSDPRAARDSLALRRAALNRGLPYFTTLAALRAAAGAIRATQLGSIGVRALQEIHPNSG